MPNTHPKIPVARLMIEKMYFGFITFTARGRISPLFLSCIKTPIIQVAVQRQTLPAGGDRDKGKLSKPLFGVIA